MIGRNTLRVDLRQTSCTAVWLLSLVALLHVGCSTVVQVGSVVGQATGTLTPQEAESLTRVAEAMDRALEKLTPEQEYYIGRAVTATILTKYRVFDDPKATRYINVLGQALAMASDRPETFKGYRFVILDSDEINAFAAPAGFIMVTRGMLRVCRNEEELAAVLAHEIGHVENQHGLKAIKAGRLTSALSIVAAEGAKQLGGKELAEATRLFEDSIMDITSTLMNNGYSRKTEFEADRSAIKILSRLGYNPTALVTMLEEMKRRLKPGGLDFAKTHPDPAVRIAEIRRILPPGSDVGDVAVRQRRFQQALAGI